jgi:hypothetical protein
LSVEVSFILGFVVGFTQPVSEKIDLYSWLQVILLFGFQCFALFLPGLAGVVLVQQSNQV